MEKIDVHHLDDVNNCDDECLLDTIKQAVDEADIKNLKRVQTVSDKEIQEMYNALCDHEKCIKYGLNYRVSFNGSCETVHMSVSYMNSDETIGSVSKVINVHNASHSVMRSKILNMMSSLFVMIYSKWEDEDTYYTYDVETKAFNLILKWDQFKQIPANLIDRLVIISNNKESGVDMKYGMEYVESMYPNQFGNEDVMQLGTREKEDAIDRYCTEEEFLKHFNIL